MPWRGRPHDARRKSPPSHYRSRPKGDRQIHVRPAALSSAVAARHRGPAAALRGLLVTCVVHGHFLWHVLGPVHVADALAGRDHADYNRHYLFRRGRASLRPYYGRLFPLAGEQTRTAVLGGVSTPDSAGSALTVPSGRERTRQEGGRRAKSAPDAAARLPRSKDSGQGAVFCPPASAF